MLKLNNQGKANFLKGDNAYSQLISPVCCKGGVDFNTVYIDKVCIVGAAVAQ